MALYSIPQSIRSMTWATWQRKHGYGLSQWAAYYAVESFGIQRKWDAVTLGEMADKVPLIDRELGRVAVVILGIAA